MTKTRFRPVTSRRIATMRLERYSFCPARRILESASPDIQYEWTFWIYTKVTNNAQDFKTIKYRGVSNQVATSSPPYNPQITSSQGVPSDQPCNSQFIKETPRRGTTYSYDSICKDSMFLFLDLNKTHIRYHTIIIEYGKHLTILL